MKIMAAMYTSVDYLNSFYYASTSPPPFSLSELIFSFVLNSRSGRHNAGVCESFSLFFFSIFLWLLWAFITEIQFCLAWRALWLSLSIPHSFFLSLLALLHLPPISLLFAKVYVVLQRFNFRGGALPCPSTWFYLPVFTSIPPLYRSPPPAERRNLHCCEGMHLLKCV